MKTILIIVLLTFIVATGATMFLTGTLEPKPTEEQLLAEGEQAASETAEGAQEGTPQAQGAGKTNTTAPSETVLAEQKALVSKEENKLAAVKTELASLTTAKAAVSKAQGFQDLAKVYSSMKPDNAASIMCVLEENLTKQILQGMTTKTAGKIMDAITVADPDYAAKITKSMAGT